MKEKELVFCLPNLANIHKGKDPEKIISEFLKANYSITCLTAENPTFNNEIEIEKIQKMNFFNYLFKVIGQYLKGKKIFFFFHLKDHHILIMSLLVFLKCDVTCKMDNCEKAGPYPWESYLDKNSTTNIFYFQKKRNVIFKSILKNMLKYLFDNLKLLIVEDDNSFEYYKNKYNIRCQFICVPNLKSPIIFNEVLNKQNILIHVARLGSPEKNTENVVKGFLNSNLKDDYKLILAGSATEEFIGFLKSNKTENIIYAGLLNEIELNNLYKIAKYLILPSKVETFSNVFSESFSHGVSVITSKNTGISHFENDWIKILRDNSTLTITQAINDIEFCDNQAVDITNWYCDFYNSNLKYSDIINYV
jgi:hypothetical protein